MTGIKRERLLEACERIGVALERVQHESQVRARIGRARVDRERGADQPISLASLAGLMLEQAQEMQRIEVCAARLENARINFLGLRQVALSVQGHGLRECLREVGCDGGRHGRTHVRAGPSWLGPNACGSIITVSIASRSASRGYSTPTVRACSPRTAGWSRTSSSRWAAGVWVALMAV